MSTCYVVDVSMVCYGCQHTVLWMSACYFVDISILYCGCQRDVLLMSVCYVVDVSLQEQAQNLQKSPELLELVVVLALVSVFG